jgi:TM2 domain-containing membrane protein YozV
MVLNHISTITYLGNLDGGDSMNRKAYMHELMNILASVPQAQRASFVSSFVEVEKNPTVIFGFSVWLGGLGIDRFVVGDIFAGVLKLLTLGGFGIWALVDLFIIGGRTRTKNIVAARALMASFGEQNAVLEYERELD